MLEMLAFTIFVVLVLRAGPGASARLLPDLSDDDSRGRNGLFLLSNSRDVRNTYRMYCAFHVLNRSV
jgi:hypothetical protein